MLACSAMGFHETIAADEEARFEGYGAELVDIQRRRPAFVRVG